MQTLFAERIKRSGRILNIHHTFGHAPKMSHASMQMAMALRFESATPRIYIELAIVRVAQNAKGKYELQQHLPMLMAEGYSKTKLAAVSKWRKSKLFDDKERAVLAYTDEVSKFGNVTDKTFKAMERNFTAQQIMELTFAIGSYYGTALMMNALKIKMEKQK